MTLNEERKAVLEDIIGTWYHYQQSRCRFDTTRTTAAFVRELNAMFYAIVENIRAEVIDQKRQRTNELFVIKIGDYTVISVKWQNGIVLDLMEDLTSIVYLRLTRALIRTSTHLNANGF